MTLGKGFVNPEKKVCDLWKCVRDPVKINIWIERYC